LVSFLALRKVVDASGKQREALRPGAVTACYWRIKARRIGPVLLAALSFTIAALMPLISESALVVAVKRSKTC